MSENPSSCTLTDGEVIFSSTDHLEWNQKKHDMMLNLGLTNNSEADQTPTPTRFIRNCEAVGLFQDLQNVNPFDEVFKKAVENPTSVSLEIPLSSSDDTLHTPQIYPHLEENLKLSSKVTATTSDNYTLNDVIPNIKQEGDDGDNPLIIVLDPESDEKTLKTCSKNQSNTSPIKVTSVKAFKDKMKQKVIAAIIQKTSNGVTPIAVDKLIDHDKQKPKTGQNIDMSELLRQREANKAAQTRCRKRKQREFEQMSTEIQNLKKENFRLTGMNLYLQETVKRLEAELRAAKSSRSMDISGSSSSVTPLTIAQTKSAESKQLEQVVIGTQVKVNSPKDPSKILSIAPKVETVVVAAPSSLALPVHNTPNSANNTVVVLCPGYIPTQSIIMPPTSKLTQSVGTDLKSIIKSNYKKIVPK